MMEFEIVDRPLINAQDDPVLQAILDTAESGKAIALPMKKADLGNWQSNMRNYARKLGYRLKYRMNNQSERLIIWAIEIEDGEEDAPLDGHVIS